MFTDGNGVQIIKFLFCCSVPDIWNNTVIALILKPGKDPHDSLSIGEFQFYPVWEKFLVL